jgi:parallel beta-helix repeat protein
MIIALLMASVFPLAFDIQLVKAAGMIYIRADGSVDPPSAPISNVGDISYTFTDDIYDSIVVERDNIVVNGAEHALEGTGIWKGIDLTGRSNVTIKSITIREFDIGIYLNHSSGNTLYANRINNTYTGIDIYACSGNSVSANTITNNKHGIFNDHSDSNNISANTITNNALFGIYLHSSSGDSISANTITNNDDVGIYLDYHSDSNSISANTITSNYYGIYLASSSGDSISTNNITSNHYEGIELYNSGSNGIYTNTITKNNGYGIYLHYHSDSNSISANTITSNNKEGIWVDSSSSNIVCHNNFVDNTAQTYVTPGFVNVWDYGYPSGGNYWSDYTGVDIYNGPNQNVPGSDGIGDSNYTINAINNDRYPLMGPISTFDCGSWDNKPYYVDIVSNSAISAFNFNATQKLIRFNVNGSSGTMGFCKITIDNLLLGGPYTALLDETPVMSSVTSNVTHSSLYFTYLHSTHNITITGSTVIPDSHSSLGLLILMFVAASALLYVKRKRLIH